MDKATKAPNSRSQRYAVELTTSEIKVILYYLEAATFPMAIVAAVEHKLKTTLSNVRPAL